MTAAGGGRLTGRRAIVTGASSGIGAATARAFVGEGASVALMARREDLLEGLARELGDCALSIGVDVSDPDAVARAVAHAYERLGGLDVAVNCAGVDGPAALADLDAAEWRRVIDVNLSGSFYVARESALRMVAAGGGAIVNVGSELSFIGMGLYVHYCASKAGVIGMTRAMAAELAPTVRVNAVCPGPVDTPMMDAELEWFGDVEATREAAVARVPLRRFASSEEVAASIVYLVADAPFATGMALALDGGTTAV